MIRKTVTSSACARIGYSPAEQLLEIEYHSKAPGAVGDVWQYCPVDASLAQRIMGGLESAGKLVGAIKRDPSIAQRKLEPSEQTCPDCGLTSEEWAEVGICGSCEQAGADADSLEPATP